MLVDHHVSVSCSVSARGERVLWYLTKESEKLSSVCMVCTAKPKDWNGKKCGSHLVLGVEGHKCRGGDGESFMFWAPLEKRLFVSLWRSLLPYARTGVCCSGRELCTGWSTWVGVCDVLVEQGGFRCGEVCCCTGEGVCVSCKGWKEQVWRWRELVPKIDDVVEKE